MSEVRVAFVVHSGRPEAQRLAASTSAWLSSEGHRVVEVEAGPCRGPVDLVVSIGGDGTMLRAVNYAMAHGAAVLGVNMGRLGYLTPVEPEGLQQALAGFLKGELEVEERMTLEVSLRRAGSEGAEILGGTALNDAVLERSGTGHTVRIRAEVNGQPFLTYACDGMIVATPTGSTAYSFSAGGPIVWPLMEAILVTPVSPHMLFDRTLVLTGSEEVVLELLDERPADLRVDGAFLATLGPGDSVTCRASQMRARLVPGSASEFHSVAREKFGLMDR